MKELPGKDGEWRARTWTLKSVCALNVRSMFRLVRIPKQVKQSNIPRLVAATANFRHYLSTPGSIPTTG
jgi:hypothetical protein